MIYFCRAHCISSKDKEITTYIVFDENTEPILTEEILRENNQFREFMLDYKPKIVYIDYSVYYTDEQLDAATYSEVFESVISNASTFYSQGEMQLENQSKAVKKRKKETGKIVALCSAIAVLFACGGGYGGYKIFQFLNSRPVLVQEPSTKNEGGMIIPIQAQEESKSKQITISIDRSYLSIPTEDLELKGTMVDGKAAITLPEFDKTDFFTHVAGYTWGFTSDPNGKKIQYYGGKTYNFSENKKLYRVLVKYGGGSGTKEDPYLIDYYDQLELIAEEKARGYFKQTDNISFPEYSNHTPINTVNELKNDPDSEYFEYDGNGFIIDGLTSPLFGTVSGATIKNVNIRNAHIIKDKYQDYGTILCNAINYQYKANDSTYRTGETLIRHCSVSHSSITIGDLAESEIVTEAIEPTTVAEVIPPDLIEYDENGKVIEPDKEKNESKPEVKPTKVADGYSIGGISGNGGQVEDCYVEDFDVDVSLDEYILNVGGISGKPANVLNCVVYNYSTTGNIFNAGGIVGSASGSRMYDAHGDELPDYYGGNIQGCLVRQAELKSELVAGGIAAVGSSNAENAMISNCYAIDLKFTVGEYDSRNKLIQEGITGGILGMDNDLRYGHIISNTVSDNKVYVIGTKDKSNYDDTVRQAPDYAYYQENILSVINSPTINPENPKEIFTGSFKFSSPNVFGDGDEKSLSYPETVEDLFEKGNMEDNENE
ncbi:hypothetical protein [Ruminococcus sp. XPD3002]|uniref:hypothetical protein n=1 Tax=Ruminococcus sp. XPD3002 TaxID=1452269 RepID=UPI000917E65A|nr:hypothetical protein SAMN04487832_105158 [Ruminococcus flavefaciens]